MDASQTSTRRVIQKEPQRKKKQLALGVEWGSKRRILQVGLLSPSKCKSYLQRVANCKAKNSKVTSKPVAKSRKWNHELQITSATIAKKI